MDETNIRYAGQNKGRKDVRAPTDYRCMGGVTDR